MVNLNIKKWAVFGLITASFTACDLDVIPPSDISAESFWTSEKDAWYGLNACYAQGNGFDIWDEMCTDNAHSHKPWEGPYESIQQSELSTAEDRGYNFSTVRIVNNFLEKVDNCEMDETLKERMKAEARFFRAQAYLDLTTKFGKVPVVTTVMEYDAPNVPRDPVDKVQAFILDELAAIAAVLPVIQRKPGVSHVPPLWLCVHVPHCISVITRRPRLRLTPLLKRDTIHCSV